jgi:K+-transporting ATPase ATPase C chain
MTSEARAEEPPDTGGEARWSHIAREARGTLAVALLLALLTGVLFPFVVIGISQVLLPSQADGSLLRNSDGQVIGSELLGQRFSGDEYFHPRPSAAGADGYDAAASSGLNFGPTNEKLAETVGDRARAYRIENGLADDAPLPLDAITTSASGLDPHISPANALLQRARVARARGMSTEAIQELIERHTDQRALGFFGEPRVNVLLLNLALDEVDR